MYFPPLSKGETRFLTCAIVVGVVVVCLASVAGFGFVLYSVGSTIWGMLS